MKTFLRLTLFLLAGWTGWATTFTEFYCINGTGTNVNAGSTDNATPVFSATSGFWTNTTAIFYKSGLNPVAGGVTVGMWASVYPDAVTNAVFIGVITNVDDTADTITLSLTQVAGTPPATDSAGATSIRVGGAWHGPYGTVGFPFDFITATATNASATASGYIPRVNFKSGTTYQMTVNNPITHSKNGPIRFEGYASSPGDLEGWPVDLSTRPTIDGGATGTSCVVLTLSAANCDLVNFIFDHNGNSGSANGLVVVSGSENYVSRVTFKDSYRSGLSTSGSSIIVVECEATGCNTANVASHGGFLSAGSGNLFVRCVSHDNAGSNNSGYVIGGNQSFLVGCIADTNGKDGVLDISTVGIAVIGCDLYGNAGAGMSCTGALASNLYLENCNFFKNTAFGITNLLTVAKNGAMRHCVFGSGTMANGGVDTAGLFGVNEIGSVTYSANDSPWQDPANGDFRIKPTATTKGLGIGTFVNATTNTVGFPDIGAAQHYESPTGAAQSSHVFAQ